MLVTLSTELGFTLVGGGGLEVARSGLIFCTLLSAGFISAHFGKARALGASLLLLGAGLALYGTASSYAGLLLALAFAGVGGGVIEALLNPLVEELHREDSGRYLNIINGFWSLGVLLTMVLGGEVLTRTGTWRPILFTLAGISLLAGAMFFLLRHAGPPRERQAMGDMFAHKREILRDRRFYLFSGMMFFGGAVEGGYTFWLASYLQLSHGGTARMGGLGTALFALGMMVGRFGFGAHVPQRGLRALVLWSAGTGIFLGPVVVLAPLGVPLWIALFAAGVATACFWPTLQSLAVAQLDLEATPLFILLSCGGIAGFTSASWLMGWLGERVGLAQAFAVVPLFGACLWVLVYRVTAQDAGRSMSSRA